jgi:hypothetical protein
LDYLDSVAQFHFDCNMDLDAFLRDFDRLVAGYSFIPEGSVLALRRPEFQDRASSRMGTGTSERRVYNGRLFEILNRTLRLDDGNRSSEIAIETVRPPGVRVILTDEHGGMFLMLREYRFEHGLWDVRLVGGKGCDSLEEFQAADPTLVSERARAAAVKETAVEDGVRIEGPEFLAISRLGASIEWDLYLYKAAVRCPATGSKAESGEFLYPAWRSKAEVYLMCVNGRVHEDRSALMLMRYLLAK